MIALFSLASLSVFLRQAHPLMELISLRTAEGSLSSLAGTISNCISAVIGGGSCSGLAFVPRTSRVQTVQEGILVSSGNLTLFLHFPVEISPINITCRGVVRVRATWTGRGVRLEVGARWRGA